MKNITQSKNSTFRSKLFKNFKWFAEKLSSNFFLGFSLVILICSLKKANADTFTVLNLNDNGPGSFRQAIQDADNLPGTDIINFNAGVIGTITLVSALPDINDPLTITGPGADVLSVSGNNTYRVFFITGGVTVNINNLTITAGNDASNGAGIYVDGSILNLSNSVVSNNSANAGAGICILPNFLGGSATITNSTISGNSATTVGGGIFAGSDGTFCSSLIITNSTISGNSSASGGGIATYCPGFGLTTITNSTLSENNASISGGGIFNQANVTLINSIVANSTGGDIVNVGGTTDAQYSLVEDGLGINGTSSNNLSGDPQLGPLANNGGPTFTHELQSGSPAIDKGSAVAGLTTDQRGLARIKDFPSVANAAAGNGSDIGAFEVQCIVDPIVINSANAGAGSLRQAVIDACPGSTITFDPAVFAAPQIITLTTGEIAINKNLTITGPAAALSVSGNNASGVFFINNLVTVNISNLTITGGNTSIGGGIFNNGGTLTVTNSTISSNTSTSSSGGGIFNNGGTLNVTNSTISNNSATGDFTDGGGIYNNGGTATLNITNSTISNNSAADSGGGIYNNGGTVNSKNTIIAGNTAINGPDFFGNVTSQGYNLIGNTSGAAIIGGSNDILNPVGGAMLGPLANNGGPTQTLALLPGSPAIDKGSSVAGLTTDQRGLARIKDFPSVANAAAGNGSDIGAFEVQCLVDPVVINNLNAGAGSLRQAVIDACPGSTITFDMTTVISPILLSDGEIILSKNLTIQGPGANTLTVQNTKAISTTSRVFLVNAGVTATISSLTISGGNHDGLGGGISNDGTLTVTNSTISGNTSGKGGGIFNFFGALTVTNSTISGNTSTASSGGGIFNNFGGTLTVTNSTISGNTSTSSGGGGILNNIGSTLTVTNSTISGNTSTHGGGIYNNNGTVNSKNTIIAGNTAANGPDFFGNLTSQGYNLIGNTSGTAIIGGSNDILNPVGGAMLGPLANNGGPTQTLALLPGSPAIDKGSFVAGITTDQRGENRPFDNPSIANASDGDGSDIGAYEGQCPTITPSISGDLSFCEGSSTTLDAGTYSGYSWSTGETSQTISVNTAETFTVTVTDASGCTGSSSVTTILNPNPVVSIRPEGSAAICEGKSIELSSNNSRLHITYPKDTLFIAGTAVFGPSISVTPVSGDIVYIEDVSLSFLGCSPYSAGSLTGKVALIDRGSCGFTTKVIHAQNAGATAVIIANYSPVLVYMSGSDPSITIPTISVSLADGLMIKNWIISGIVSGHSEVESFSYLWSTGETTQSITTSLAGNYTLEITDANGCKGTGSTLINVNPTPEPIISGNVSFCEGSSTTFDAGAGYIDYIWSTGEPGQTISVSTAETFTVTVTDANGCTGSASVTTIVNPNPTPSIDGKLSFCDGNSTTLDAGKYFSYSWSTGETSQTISVSTAETFTVTVADGNGCTGSASVTTTVETYAIGAISGPAGVCSKQCGVVYCVTNSSPGILFYNWTLPTGASVIGASNGPCITLKFSSKFKGGSICAEAATPCSFTQKSCMNVVRITKKPNMPGNITGPSTLCPNATATYSIGVVPTATSYSWSVPSNMQILSGQGSTSIVVKAKSSFNSGYVKVRAMNCKDGSGSKSMNLVKSRGCRLSAASAIPESEITSQILSAFNVYPNPTSGKLSISFTSESKSKFILNVMDLLGKKVLMNTIEAIEGENKTSLDMSHLAKGMYFILLEMNGMKTQTLRIVVE